MSGRLGAQRTRFVLRVNVGKQRFPSVRWTRRSRLPCVRRIVVVVPAGREGAVNTERQGAIHRAKAGKGNIHAGGKLPGGVVGTLLSGAAGGGVLLEIRGVGRRCWQMTKRGKPHRHSTTSPTLSPQTWGHYQDAQRQRQACDLACPSR